ncbi:DUF5301 domain-containing protein [Streptococcus suis]
MIILASRTPPQVDKFYFLEFLPSGKNAYLYKSKGATYLELPYEKMFKTKKDIEEILPR